MMALDTVQPKAMLAAGTPIADAVFDDVDWSDLDAEAASFTDCRFNAAHFEKVDFSGLTLTHLASFARMKITQSQQHILLGGIGVDVHPDPG
jgi:uncharacterized protein YjbI with pentapeptide repeats